MRRLAATLRTDVRVQLRNGFYAATALIVIASVALLRWLPHEAATLLLPVVILQNVIVNSFYFVSGLVLLERVEGTFVAQSVTPLRVGEYLGSKLATLTTLSLVESLLIAIAVFGVAPSLLLMAIGVALAAVLFCLVGVALVVRYESINEFLLPSVLYTFALSLPLLGILDIGSDTWYLAHPIQGPIALMQLDARHPAHLLIYAIGYPLLWIAPAYLWSRSALARARCA